LIPEVKPAVDAFLEAGFLNANRDFEAGGMQLPSLVSQACFAHFQAANAGTTAYPFLTMGAANLVESFGTEEQKRLYLQPMIDGRYFGTMALTEPHAGSSLADIRTRAEPADDGTYRLKGNKIFISGGDHELSENIVHMVLAKLPDAPPGVKGFRCSSCRSTWSTKTTAVARATTYCWPGCSTRWAGAAPPPPH
jgi:Acyl-CoA dehydrogenases